METREVNSPRPASMLFTAVARKDHEALIQLYASNAQNSLISYLSMKSRLSRQQEFYSRSEEKLDEYLQQASDETENNEFSPRSYAKKDDDPCFYFLLQELSQILSGENLKQERDCEGSVAVKVSKEVNQLLWETSGFLSDSRPPSDFCVYKQDSEKASSTGDQGPPIFDGSVANATPPPLGGPMAVASGGAGTVLHLACAIDSPLLLAFLMSMGVDGRATHTAFRRLMIHEAACNGSIKCLALLLELGQTLSEKNGEEATKSVASFQHALALPAEKMLTGRSIDQGPIIPSIRMNLRQFREQPERCTHQEGNFLLILRKFRYLSQKLQSGDISELDAARSLLDNITLTENTRSSLLRSCCFDERPSCGSFLRPRGTADGHGNTALHWASFKNESLCVELLLKFSANPNAKAHPSGWTPLHDAAYSNSTESIKLLIANGAQVDARANSGATPLCFAAQEDAFEAARILLQKGADLTARCAASANSSISDSSQIHSHSRFSGYTPLHYCAHYNAHKAAQILLADCRAETAMETPDLSGRLPIHVAVARGSSDVLRELLHAGARIDTRMSPQIDTSSPRSSGGPNAFFALPDVGVQASALAMPGSPTLDASRARSGSQASSSPVTSPVLRSLIPEQPILSTKPWNCLSQKSIDECKELICKAELSWSPDRHLLFTPQDRKAVMELLRVGKRLEQQGVLFVDLWPLVLGFCGRGWFDLDGIEPLAIDFVNDADPKDDISDEVSEVEAADDYLTLPTLSD